MNQILDQAFGFGFGMGWECVLEISDVFGKDGFLCEDGDADYHLWHGKYELNRDELPCSVPRWGVEPQARPPCWLKPSWGQFAWIAPVFVHLQADFSELNRWKQLCVFGMQTLDERFICVQVEARTPDEHSGSVSFRKSVASSYRPKSTFTNIIFWQNCTCFFLSNELVRLDDADMVLTLLR